MRQYRKHFQRTWSCANPPRWRAHKRKFSHRSTQMNTDQSTGIRHFRRLSVLICVHLWLVSPAFADQHTFIYDASKEASKPHEVFLAGDFNGWSKNATPMTDEGLAQFKATLDIEPGVHFYKFVADDKWITDPASDKELEVDDGHGGK